MSIVLSSVAPCVLAFLRHRERGALRSTHSSLMNKRAVVHAADASELPTVVVSALESLWVNLTRDEDTAAFENSSLAISRLQLFDVRAPSLSCSQVSLLASRLEQLRPERFRLRTNGSLLNFPSALSEREAFVFTSTLSRLTQLDCDNAALVLQHYASMSSLRVLRIGIGNGGSVRFVSSVTLPELESLSVRGLGRQWEWSWFTGFPKLKSLECSCVLAASDVQSLPVLRVSQLTLLARDLSEAFTLAGFASLLHLDLQLRSRRVQATVGVDRLASTVVYETIHQLESLATMNVPFPPRVHSAPILKSLVVAFHDSKADYCDQAGCFPLCPVLERLTLDIRSLRPKFEIEPEAFAQSVLVGGLSGWLSGLERLKSLTLLSDGSADVYVGYLPKSLECLSLIGLHLFYSGMGDVWSVLQEFPLTSLVLSTTEPECQRARDRQRARETLRNAVVVLSKFKF
jgi:hypothetical protein